MSTTGMSLQDFDELLGELSESVEKQKKKHGKKKVIMSRASKRFKDEVDSLLMEIDSDIAPFSSEESSEHSSEQSNASLTVPDFHSDLDALLLETKQENDVPQLETKILSINIKPSLSSLKPSSTLSKIGKENGLSKTTQAPSILENSNPQTKVEDNVTPIIAAESYNPKDYNPTEVDELLADLGSLISSSDHSSKKKPSNLPLSDQHLQKNQLSQPQSNTPPHTHKAAPSSSSSSSTYEPQYLHSPSVSTDLCYHCGGPINDFYMVMRAFGKVWHKHHFVCVQCKSPFKYGQYFQKENEPYCYNCYNGIGTKCRQCCLFIKTSPYKALGSDWHDTCFNCSVCKKNLVGFDYRSKDGLPFCPNHVS
eukprot:TRINITY_DN7932_c0_g1_i1.p1 TRINITY_DN7932_c0_g1~~TRINITY_DN7932_c0_g1_i1.p1  ORF type:complete len:398 (-),score=63.53 TRINITY_DN7932_c0_g1_i1:33-1130(-)